MLKELMVKNKKRVFVAMSGGVDSSVSAALLKKEGYDVVGVFMKVWQPDFLPCTWEAERRDALRVAAHLGIPLLTWDFEKEYKQYVADYMIREYKAGRTPNPDVLCNKEVKFGAFFRRTMTLGADAVATGHYARVAYNKKAPHPYYQLLTGIDETKDQSYFLWTLTQEQLTKTFFPIGKYEKTHVRTLAKKFNIPVAEKKDSQGLCFVGKLDMKDFLAHYITEKEGVVLNEAGEDIGTHRGAYFYTLGERHGFLITQKTTDEAPYYVVAKDLEANTITVAHRIKNSLPCERKTIPISQTSFCAGTPPSMAQTYTAQVRYHGEQYPCRLVYNDSTITIEFLKSVIVDKGQSIVLYKEGECIGGGIAEE